MSPPISAAIMAKAPVPGLCKTRLCPPLSLDQAASVHAALLADSVAWLESVPLHQRLLLAAPESDGVARLQALYPSWNVQAQVGGELGARMDAALGMLLGGGAAGAFLIGSDAPEMPLEAVRQGAAWLGSAAGSPPRVLLGPALDGGYWLVGVSQPAPWLFANMVWSTSHVLEQTLQRAASHGAQVMMLPRCQDVDDVDSLRSVLPVLVPGSALHTLMAGPLGQALLQPA